MSHLTVYPDTNAVHPLLDTADGILIAETLANIGVRFERWEASEALPHDADDQRVMDAYRADIDRLMRENGYQSVDVLRCLPDNPKKEELRAKFLSEHTHDEDEVRFFVEGAGMFYLRKSGKVYRTLCERGDLIGVPSGIQHWFDMGPAPHFTAIRLFTNPEGWIANFTGDPIASNFPKYEPVLAA